MSMSTTHAMVLTGVVVTAGRWNENKTMDVRVVVGVVGLTIMLASMPEDIGRAFALLILVSAMFRYGIPLATSLSGQSGSAKGGAK